MSTSSTASLEIETVSHPVRATLRPPGSKSITNRALICAALAEGESTLTGALDCEDTRVMVAALQELGIHVAADWDRATLVVEGCGGRIPKNEANLSIANSGTSMRFLTALVSLGGGPKTESRYRLDGTARMRERPIQDLLDALAALGVDARSEPGNGCPPVVVRAKGLPGGSATIAGGVSSQFLSGLLMVAPYAREPIEIEVAGELVSQPYVSMTLKVMSAFGIAAVSEGLSKFRFEPPRYELLDRSAAPASANGSALRYKGREFAIEPDASAASYFLGAAAITGGEAKIVGLTRESLQGDVAFAEVLKRMGCDLRYGAESITVIGRRLRGVDVNMNAFSDTAQTLAAVALFAEGTTTIRGIGHNRHKETDRIGDLATELRKLGAEVEEFDDGLRITPRVLHGAEVKTYNDHRMAMSLSLVGLRVPGVRILDPGCTAKTYPDFFSDLAFACGRR